MSTVVVTGSFDDLRTRQMRFLHEASRRGNVSVLLWSDEALRVLHGQEPRFPQEERLYFLQAIRYVHRVALVSGPIEPNVLPAVEGWQPDLWAVEEADDNAQKRAFCQAEGIAYHVVTEADLRGFPPPGDEGLEAASSRRKVIVTGCYDWLHSGHVRFFEEASEYGDLYVGVGNDDNLRRLKGEGHPLFPQEERRYMVQSIRYVRRAFVSSGYGWLDAEPEIARIQPDIYLVNEDGDRPEKRAFCQAHGLEYVVLKRLPKPGLPRRRSTELRGF